MSDKKLYKAQKRYTMRNVNRGERRVTTWVPEIYAEELKEIAKAMRDGTWEDD